MKQSNYYLLPLAILLAVMAALISCHGRWEDNNSGNTITVTGRVINQSTGQPLDSALVEISAPPQFKQTTLTDSAGAYRFEIESEKDLTLSIKASRDEFDSQTRSLEAASGTDKTNIDLQLAKKDSTGGGDNGGKGKTGKGAAAITLAGSPPDAISIAATGNNVSAPITFQVVDSAGQPLNKSKAVEVDFTLTNSPGGKEHLIPQKTTTNAQGKATTTLYSGNQAGVVKLQAVIKAGEMGFQMKSSPVQIAIHGGYPDEKHFSISASQRNIDVANDGNLPAIRVSMGDRFSNPAKPGTAVSFKTSGGVIQGSAATDKDGHASVNFTSLQPRPKNGTVSVTASTINSSDKTVSKNIKLVFSTAQAKIAASPSSFELKSAESRQISYTVTDEDGNPMAKGTKISVKTDSSVSLSGDTNLTLGDYISGGAGKTTFNFTLRDKGQSENKKIGLSIKVTPPAGSPTAYTGFDIERVVPGHDKVGAAAIVLTKPPENAINISETGDDVSAPMTFQVQDSLGRPLTADNEVNVQFTLVNSPGGGEDLVPHEAKTDGQGNVTTTLFSGNRAGAVKVQASVQRSDIGLTIKSKPVLIAIHGGFPDKRHFSIAPDKHNFEGFSVNNNHNTITVVLGDKFSNPVKPGTVVYFSTDSGIIQGSASTDEDGIASVDLISGDPRSSDGKATVTASTVNENDQRIQKTTDIIFGGSQATITAGPNNFDIGNGGSEQFTYTITDKNGNPMPAGTRISIDAGSGLELSGDINFTLGDYLEAGPNRTEFNFSASDANKEPTNDAVTIKISVTTPKGNTTTYSGLQGTRH